jgi:hypothetical protein
VDALSDGVQRPLYRSEAEALAARGTPPTATDLLASTGGAGTGTAAAQAHVHAEGGDGIVSLALSSIRGADPEPVGVNFSLFGGNPSLGLAAPVAKSFPPRRKTTLFIACITAQTDRAVRQRDRVRSTWLGHANAQFMDGAVVAKFFLGIAVQSKADIRKNTAVAPVSDQVLAEMKEFGDIVVVDAPDTYEGLINKVRTVLQWIDNDREVEYVAKVDDDCYVNVAVLLAEIKKLPATRTYFGHMMAGGKVLVPHGMVNLTCLDRWIGTHLMPRVLDTRFRPIW